jgi:hypothetical protein
LSPSAPLTPLTPLTPSPPSTTSKALGRLARRPAWRLAWLMTAASLPAHSAWAAGATCQASASASAAPPTVVELYTSEGCSSCPPADKWLSTLKGRPDVLALSFHVNYWDRLGWPDRFASAEATARQHELARVFGSSQVYTPQVVVNGRDWRQWPRLPKPGLAAASTAAAAPAAPAVTLNRDGEQVTARVSAGDGNAMLGGYWAVLEDGHLTKVRAGENSGETLRHDHVVRLYKPVPPWAAAQGASAQLTVSRGAAEFPRRVVFVVTDAATQRPLQAVTLGC